MLHHFRILWGVLLLHEACFPAVMTKDDAISKSVVTDKIAVLQDLTDEVEVLLHSCEMVAFLERSEINSLVWTVQKVLHTLKKAQEKAWNNFIPKNCSSPLAPSNGGLACVTIASVRYCKPMCNQGYDFTFLRRSRLYEECGYHTGYSWTTQLVGGSKLAECIASSVAVSGQTSAYFPSNMNCQETIANRTLEEEHIRTFLQELASKDITEKHESAYDYVICG